jgi:succinoglycan biosynthesis protein ExoM
MRQCRNISIARNAALDVAETLWVAFIDDDEHASATWLANL